MQVASELKRGKVEDHKPVSGHSVDIRQQKKYKATNKLLEQYRANQINQHAFFEGIHRVNYYGQHDNYVAGMAAEMLLEAADAGLLDD